MRISGRWMLMAAAFVVGLACLAFYPAPQPKCMRVAARYQLHDRTTRFFDRAGQVSSPAPRKSDSDRKDQARPSQGSEGKRS